MAHLGGGADDDCVHQADLGQQLVVGHVVAAVHGAHLLQHLHAASTQLLRHQDGGLGGVGGHSHDCGAGGRAREEAAVWRRRRRQGARVPGRKPEVGTLSTLPSGCPAPDQAGGRHWQNTCCWEQHHTLQAGTPGGCGAPGAAVRHGHARHLQEQGTRLEESCGSSMQAAATLMAHLGAQACSLPVLHPHRGPLYPLLRRQQGLCGDGCLHGLCARRQRQLLCTESYSRFGMQYAGVKFGFQWQNE